MKKELLSSKQEIEEIKKAIEVAKEEAKRAEEKKVDPAPVSEVPKEEAKEADEKKVEPEPAPTKAEVVSTETIDVKKTKMSKKKKKNDKKYKESLSNI